MIISCIGLFAYGVYSVYRPDAGPVRFVRGEVRNAAPGIMVGPYPTREELKALKRRGVVEVVNLMDTSSIVEAPLIEEEKKAAADLGLSFSNFPADYVQLESRTSMGAYLKAVDHVTKSGNKTYVHCYLGRHRVGMFEKELKKALTGYGETQH